MSNTSNNLTFIDTGFADIGHWGSDSDNELTDTNTEEDHNTNTEEKHTKFASVLRKRRPKKRQQALIPNRKQEQFVEQEQDVEQEQEVELCAYFFFMGKCGFSKCHKTHFSPKTRCPSNAIGITDFNGMALDVWLIDNPTGRRNIAVECGGTRVFKRTVDKKTGDASDWYEDQGRKPVFHEPSSQQLLQDETLEKLNTGDVSGAMKDIPFKCTGNDTNGYFQLHGFPWAGSDGDNVIIGSKGVITGPFDAKTAAKSLEKTRSSSKKTAYTGRKLNTMSAKPTLDNDEKLPLSWVQNQPTKASEYKHKFKTKKMRPFKTKKNNNTHSVTIEQQIAQQQNQLAQLAQNQLAQPQQQPAQPQQQPAQPHPDMMQMMNMMQKMMQQNTVLTQKLAQISKPNPPITLLQEQFLQENARKKAQRRKARDAAMAKLIREQEDDDSQ